VLFNFVQRKEIISMINKKKILLFRLLARLRQIANDNEKIGNEERTLARLNFIIIKKMKKIFSKILVWFGLVHVHEQYQLFVRISKIHLNLLSMLLIHRLVLH
jgi:hypothetical protein